MERRVAHLEDSFEELKDEVDFLKAEIRSLRCRLRDVPADRDSAASEDPHRDSRDSRRGAESGSEGSFRIVRDFDAGASRSRTDGPSPPAFTPSDRSPSAADSRGPSAASTCSLTWLERENICDDIAEHIRRALQGDHRGNSGRERIPLASRIWLVFRDFEGVVYQPVRVCRTLGECRALVKRGESCGDSVFIGLPSEREACRVAGVSGVGWPFSRR